MSDSYSDDMANDELGLDMILNVGHTDAQSTPVSSVSASEVDVDEEFNDEEVEVLSSRQETLDRARTMHTTQTTKTKSFTAEEIADMKHELLYQLDRLEKKGVRAKKFTMASPYDDIKAELERIKRDRDVASSVRFQRMIFSTCVHGIEFLNNKYDPFDVRLEGWSENIHEDMNDYDDIFEELHEKYKGKGRVAPELKLMFMLGGSAVKFHFMNTLVKSAMPGFDQVMKQNPDLMRQFAQATAAASATMPQQQETTGMFGKGGLSGILGGMFGAPAPAPAPPKKMRGPAKDILTDLEGGGDLDVISVASGDSLAKIKPRKQNKKTLQI
jgi:hypothetical protein